MEKYGAKPTDRNRKMFEEYIETDTSFFKLSCKYRLSRERIRQIFDKIDQTIQKINLLKK
jgi:predicted DNA-binding protein YlxM (UPF0122 family)